ncbi:multidrug effflux MFS transporter [Thiohalorhabdus methylotrophus]|uniref:Bcr/CflA family efflux transporter n=1 Tax=Thiohalorhabdus methylotrophus TaxID=3242694 RepID=A0ABV4TYX6_9GAMM
MNHSRLALLLGASVAVSPLAMDAYLPAFPEIARTFGIPNHQVGMSVSIYLLGLALGHLIGGPLSDRYGRQRVMLGGLGMFVAGSLLLGFSASFDALLGWRFLQALGGGFCVVSVPAIARDHTSGAEGARLFSLIALVTFVAPATAPTIGTGILHLTSWPGIFFFLALYAATIAVLLRVTLFRSYPHQPGHCAPLHTLVTNYLHVLRHGTAMRLLGIQALVFSVMMVYITHGSFILQDWYGLSKPVFSAIMAGTVGAMAAFNISNRWLLRRWSPAIILRAAVLLQAAALLYLVAVVHTSPRLALFLPGLILALGSFGAGVPNTFSLFLEFFREMAATAAALMGALRFSIAGTISGLSSQVVGGSLSMVVLMMAGCSLTALFLAWNTPHAVARSGEQPS